MENEVNNKSNEEKKYFQITFSIRKYNLYPKIEELFHLINQEIICSHEDEKTYKKIVYALNEKEALDYIYSIHSDKQFINIISVEEVISMNSIKPNHILKNNINFSDYVNKINDTYYLNNPKEYAAKEIIDLIHKENHYTEEEIFNFKNKIEKNKEFHKHIDNINFLIEFSYMFESIDSSCYAYRKLLLEKKNDLYYKYIGINDFENRPLTATEKENFLIIYNYLLCFNFGNECNLVYLHKNISNMEHKIIDAKQCYDDLFFFLLNKIYFIKEECSSINELKEVKNNIFIILNNLKISIPYIFDQIVKYIILNLIEINNKSETI